MSCSLDTNKSLLICKQCSLVGIICKKYSKFRITIRPPNVGDLSKALAIIMCTSGTTSMPKAVRISHEMANYGIFKGW